MDAATYCQDLCADCSLLVHAGPGKCAHLHLGLPREEVGYTLYRCARCHSRWSFGPRGWIEET